MEEWAVFLIGACGIGMLYVIEKLDNELSAKKRNYLWLEVELEKERNKSIELRKQLEDKQQIVDQIREIVEQSE